VNGSVPVQAGYSTASWRGRRRRPGWAAAISP